MDYTNLMELAEYVQDHITAMKELFDPSMDGDDMDHVLARCTQAKRRLTQIEDAMLEQAG